MHLVAVGTYVASFPRPVTGRPRRRIPFALWRSLLVRTQSIKQIGPRGTVLEEQIPAALAATQSIPLDKISD